MLGFHSSGIYNGVLSSIYSDADILLAIATAASGEERKSRRRRRRRQQTGRLQMRWALPDKCSRCRDRDLEEETVAVRVRQGERGRQRERDKKKQSETIQASFGPSRRSSRHSTHLSTHESQLISSQLISTHHITDQFTAAAPQRHSPFWA